MKSFLADRQRVSSPAVVHTHAVTQSGFGAILGAAHAHLPSARQDTPASAVASPAAQVECIREGEKISRIIVTCSCGERIEIDCVYPIAR